MKIKLLEMCILSMDYNRLNSEILKLNSKIRYAGVYHIGTEKIFEKLQNGISRLVETETTRDMLIHAYMRWKTRQHNSDAIGEPMYTITKYGKINRLVIPLHSKALLMINTEPEIESQDLVDNIIKLIKQYSDDPNYIPRQIYLG